MLQKPKVGDIRLTIGDCEELNISKILGIGRETPEQFTRLVETAFKTQNPEVKPTDYSRLGEREGLMAKFEDYGANLSLYHWKMRGAIGTDEKLDVHPRIYGYEKDEDFENGRFFARLVRVGWGVKAVGANFQYFSDPMDNPEARVQALETMRAMEDLVTGVRRMDKQLIYRKVAEDLQVLGQETKATVPLTQ